mgnify:CR=1 FL=1
MLLMVKRMLSIMGIVELLRAAKCCTWYNVLLLSLIAAAVCMRRLSILRPVSAHMPLCFAT